MAKKKAQHLYELLGQKAREVKEAAAPRPVPAKPEAQEAPASAAARRRYIPVEQAPVPAPGPVGAGQERALEDAATIVFIGDIFPPEQMDRPAEIKAQLARLMGRGCGIVCVHYATGLRGNHVRADGDHPLLHWLGGYFASGCPHHASVARVCTATLAPENNNHPILQGWRSFTFDDEPYWKIYFGKEGAGRKVTPLVYAMLPPGKPEKETVAWAIEREDGGRGAGIVVPHFFRSWRIDDLRTLGLNSVFWTAKLDVPPSGVKSSLPELAVFKPGAIDP